MKTAFRIFGVTGAALFLCACVSVDQRRRIEDIRVPAEYGRGDSGKNVPTEALVRNARQGAGDTIGADHVAAGRRVTGGPRANAEDHSNAAGPAVPADGESPLPETAQDAWWRQFGDSRLNRLVERVLEVNTDLVSAGLRLQRARLTAGLAKDQLFPHVDASVNASYDKALNSGVSGTHGNGAATSVSYILDLWGKLRAQRDVALWEAQARAEDLQSTRLALIADTADLYWTLGFFNQRIAVGQESLACIERTLALVRTQLAAGALSRLELRETEQSLQSQLAAQSQLEQQRVRVRNALTVLLDGRPWPQGDEPQSLEDTRNPEIQAGLPAELLARRPDLRAAELRLRGALASIGIAATSYYPTLSLTGSLAGSSSALSDVLANPSAGLGAGLALPFLQWSEMTLNVDLAKTDYEIAANDFRRALYTAFTEVDNALSARTKLAEQADASRKSLAAAAEVERLYEVRYRAGAAPLRTWLDAQESRRNAELSFAQVRLEQLRNDLELFQALGGSGR